MARVFPDQPQVIQDLGETRFQRERTLETLDRFFGPPQLPARTTIESGFMVDGILVEIDCVAARVR